MTQLAPSSSFFSSSFTYTHDVFLSFRGKDTRTGFTGNLYNALDQRGTLTFIDDDGLRKGEEITPSLLKAIQESRMAIIIFSKDYASSTFCLNELVEILECMKKKGQWTLPIFYDVDPSDVRHQRGSFGEALANHERGRFKDNMEKVQKWRLALREAANLSGWHFDPRLEYEYLFMRRIIDEVSGKLSRPPMHVASHPVGLEARVRDVQSLMDAELDRKVSMIGIYGTGGIGKSTIARAIYNSIANQFESSCFLADIREKSTGHGLVQIQETLLSELVGERNIKLGDVNQGIPILKERLRRKKVLVILDDVDERKQLQATAGGLEWFGSGSIIIITTRDKHLLEIHGIEKIYEVNGLNDAEALEFFRWNAFKNCEADPSYSKIIERAIHYAGGLPLVLETIGSNLFGKTLDEWQCALDAYNRCKTDCGSCDDGRCKANCNPCNANSIVAKRIAVFAMMAVAKHIAILAMQIIAIAKRIAVLAMMAVAKWIAILAMMAIAKWIAILAMQIMAVAKRIAVLTMQIVIVEA